MWQIGVHEYGSRNNNSRTFISASFALTGAGSAFLGCPRAAVHGGTEASRSHPDMAHELPRKVAQIVEANCFARRGDVYI
jgi:hypothetical protein